MLMDRCGGDDAAVLVAAVWPLILTGEHRQRIYPLFNNAVQSREVGLVDLLIRIDLEDLDIVVLVRDEDAVTDLHLLNKCERSGFGGVQVVMSRDH